MKRFLLNLFGVLGTALLILACIYWYAETIVELENYDNHFLAATIDRHARLDTLAKPRVIFVGASNLAFGIDTEYLQDEFKKPVVNLGLHGALGTAYVFNEALDTAEKGDVLIFCIAHFFKSNGSKKMHYLLNKMYPETKKWTSNISVYYRLKYWTDDAVRTIQKAKKQGFRPRKKVKKKSVYQRDAFNQYGDIVAHLDIKDVQQIPWNRDWQFDGFEEDIQQLNNFYQKAVKKGCKVYMMYPAYPKHIHEELEEDLKTLHSFYDNIEIPIINQVDDVVYPADHFFDSVYHLSKKGRERWNKEIASLLMPFVTTE